MKNKLFFALIALIVVSMVSYSLAQVGNYNISKRCGATSVEGDYAYKIYPTSTNYYVELVAGRCEKPLRGTVNVTSNVRSAIRADVISQISQKNMTWEVIGGLKDSEIDGRGNFTLT